MRGRYFNDADNETTENVAIVNEAFVKRFFKNDENPLDQAFRSRFAGDTPDTFRIVGIVRDAKFAGWAFAGPHARCSTRPWRRASLSTKTRSCRISNCSSHFIGGIMLVTNVPPGILEPLLTRELAQVGSQSHHRQCPHACSSRSTFPLTRNAPSPVLLDCLDRRSAPRRRRTLWRDRLYGRAPDQRNRHSHGARRRPQSRCPTRSTGCVHARLDRISSRTPARRRRRKIDVRATLRRLHLRSRPR